MPFTWSMLLCKLLTVVELWKAHAHMKSVADVELRTDGHMHLRSREKEDNSTRSTGHARGSAQAWVQQLIQERVQTQQVAGDPVTATDGTGSDQTVDSPPAQAGEAGNDQPVEAGPGGPTKGAGWAALRKNQKMNTIREGIRVAREANGNAEDTRKQFLEDFKNRATGEIAKQEREDAAARTIQRNWRGYRERQDAEARVDSGNGVGDINNLKSVPELIAEVKENLKKGIAAAEDVRNGLKKTDIPEVAGEWTNSRKDFQRDELALTAEMRRVARKMFAAATEVQKMLRHPSEAKKKNGEALLVNLDNKPFPTSEDFVIAALTDPGIIKKEFGFNKQPSPQEPSDPGAQEPQEPGQQPVVPAQPETPVVTSDSDNSPVNPQQDGDGAATTGAEGVQSQSQLDPNAAPFIPQSQSQLDPNAPEFTPGVEGPGVATTSDGSGNAP